jgi:hypothetical protein
MPPAELTPSPELIRVVRAERERLEELMTSLQARSRELETELSAVIQDLRAASERDIELARLVGEDPGEVALDGIGADLFGGETDDDNGRHSVRRALRRRRARSRGSGGLRGAEIRAAAVKAALVDAEPGRPRHYKEWLSLVEVAGERIDGRDPAATLLTQLSRCPLITRAPNPGVYRLDRNALVELQACRAALRAEADEHVTATDNRTYDAIDLAQALAAVEANVRRIDREIDEATTLVERLDAKGFFTRPQDIEDRSSQPERSPAIAA